MFDYVRLFGPSENWGPHILLTELDELLLSVGWTRVGLDPHTLDYSKGDNTTGDNHNHKREPLWGPFGYQQPGTDEIVWFMANPQWGQYSTAIYNVGLQLYLGFKPAWDPSVPDSVTLLASHYHHATHINEDAEWVIGAGPEGFYLTQTRGQEPGGFVVERLQDGSDRWLVQTFDNQNRWHYITNWSYTVTGVGASNNMDQWYDQNVDALFYRRHDPDIGYLGRATLLNLVIEDDNTGGQVITPDGPLQYGYWYHVPGYYPVTSRLMRRWYEPNNYTEVVEGSEVMRFQKFGGQDQFVTHSWRVA